MLRLSETLELESLIESVIFGGRETVCVTVNNAGIDKAVLSRESGTYTVSIPDTKVKFYNFSDLSLFMDQLRTIKVE